MSIKPNSPMMKLKDQISTLTDSFISLPESTQETVVALLESLKAHEPEKFSLSVRYNNSLVVGISIEPVNTVGYKHLQPNLPMELKSIGEINIVYKDLIVYANDLSTLVEKTTGIGCKTYHHKFYPSQKELQQEIEHLLKDIQTFHKKLDKAFTPNEEAEALGKKIKSVLEK